ncbi:MAG: hypothetical protein R3C26_17420 [Calditrichia bacterium]
MLVSIAGIIATVGVVCDAPLAGKFRLSHPDGVVDLCLAIGLALFVAMATVIGSGDQGFAGKISKIIALR